MSGLTPRPKETVECCSPDGRLVALVEIIPEDDWQTDVPELAPLVRLTALEAKAQGEQPIQLRENGRYEYSVQRAAFAGPGNLKLVGNVVRNRKSRTSGDNDIGRIETGSHCGLLRLDIEEDGRPGDLLATGYVEVRSIKIRYRDEYQRMLEYISAQTSQLLFDARASAQMPVVPKWTHEPPLLQQQIEFLRQTLASSSFDAAVRRIESFPHQQLRTQSEECNIARPFRPGRNFNRQAASAGHRVVIPSTHALYSRLSARGAAVPSLPSNVVVQRKRDLTDTPENRFVKHAITQFRDFLSHAAQVLSQAKDASWHPVRKSAINMTAKLDEILCRSFFRGISALRMLPLGSPVLQRKPGYREILQYWQRFNDNSQVRWKGGDEIYHAGKRDVVTLYEYWLFFQLLHWFCGKFSPNGGVPAAKQLIEPVGKGRFNLRLQRPWTLGPFEGIYARNQRKLCARFHYNQRFRFVPGRTERGSWTRAMHPDYTLTFWPADYTPDQAEEQELAVHIHFDSKYRVESLEDLFGKPVEDADAEDTDSQGRGNYKRADLLKMHAYRDAIRRSEGAYVLYPGSDADRKHQESLENEFKGFHEILPGLGAFAIAPGSDGKAKGMEHLNRFLDEVLEHLSNLTTSRERVTYHLREAYKPDTVSEAPAEYKIHNAIPERDGMTGGRLVPPSEHSILVGWYENADASHLDWILSSAMYNFRAGDRAGSIRLEPGIAGARHLLLHSYGGYAHPALWRIKNAGPRLFTADELLKAGYPPALDPHPDAIYAVYDVEPDEAYSGWKGNLATLRGKKAGRQSAMPFAVTLV